jgi:hypothetical protein
MQLTDLVEIALNKLASNMWDRALTVFAELLGTAEAGYATKATCEFVLLL